MDDLFLKIYLYLMTNPIHIDVASLSLSNAAPTFFPKITTSLLI
jgi:hypothetical protein